MHGDFSLQFRQEFTLKHLKALLAFVQARVSVNALSLFNNIIISIFYTFCYLASLLPADMLHIYIYMFYSPGRFLIDESLTTSVRRETYS